MSSSKMDKTSFRSLEAASPSSQHRCNRASRWWMSPRFLLVVVMAVAASAWMCTGETDSTVQTRVVGETTGKIDGRERKRDLLPDVVPSIPSLLGLFMDRKRDVHVHHIPPPYAAALRALDVSHVDGQSIKDLEDGVLSWTEDGHLELNRDLGVEKSYLSISSPGVHLTPGADKEARELAMACNDWTADLCRRHPNDFGMFASLPLPDVEGSVAEARRVRDKHGVNAFALLTNHHGVYLGDASFTELYEDLNAKSSVVFIHPTAPCIRVGPDSHTQQGASFDSRTRSEQPLTVGADTQYVHASPLVEYADPMLEFQLETARALTHLILSGTVTAYPNIRWIAPHTGGAFPAVLDRVRIMGFTGFAGMDVKVSWIEFGEALDKFWWDLAGFPIPNQLPGLMRHLGDPENASHKLMYGSDYAWTPEIAVKGLTVLLEVGLEELFEDEGQRERIWRGNAVELLEDGGKPEL